ncbi:MAG: 50S ribosomal protein L25 [Planctomycetota bacterium]
MAHEIPTLAAETRDRVGTRYARRLREVGQVPAVVYGHKQEPVSVALNLRDLDLILAHGAHTLKLELPTGAETCLVRDVQRDHLGDKVVHVDLARVDLSETVEVEIDLEFYGESPALKEAGSVLLHEMQTLTVACRADSVPDGVRVDTSGLTRDSHITVADLVLPEGVAAADDPEKLVASISFVKAAPVEEETDEAAEPEVVGEKKDGD